MKAQETFYCSHCKSTLPRPTGTGGTGYAVKRNGHKVCYACCADVDRKFMVKHGENWMYLSDGKLTNWPGTLTFKPFESWSTGHNWYGVTQRYVRFNGPDGYVWTGRQVGENSDCCRVRRTKQEVAS